MRHRERVQVGDRDLDDLGTERAQVLEPGGEGVDSALVRAVGVGGGVRVGVRVRLRVGVRVRGMVRLRVRDMVGLRVRLRAKGGS